MVIATERFDVMPEFENLTKTYNFKSMILPSKTSQLYKVGLTEYKSMSKALRVYLHKSATIPTSCTILHVRKKICQYERDGFKLLLQLLAAIFPSLGGPQLDIIAEISSIRARQGETLDSLLHKFLDMDEKLRVSKHHVSATALMKRYLQILKKDSSIFPLISPIQRKFHKHLLSHGPDTKFSAYTIYDLHEYLSESGIDGDTVLNLDLGQVTPQVHKLDSSLLHYVAPQANVAVKSAPSTLATTIPQMAQTRGRSPSPARRIHDSRTRSTSGDRPPICPICFQRHIPSHCYARGPAYQPVWLKRNVAKYNATHKNDEPHTDFINRPAPLRMAQVHKSVHFAEDKNNSDSDTSQITIYHDPEEDYDDYPDKTNNVYITSTCNMALSTSCNNNAHDHSAMNNDEDDNSFVEY